MDIRQSARNLFVGVPQAALGIAFGVISTSVGIVASVASIVTGGKLAGINRLANETLKNTKYIVSSPFASVIRVLNTKYVSPAAFKEGTFATAISNKVFDKARILTYSNNPLVERLASRVTYLAGAVLSVATRTADLALGVLSGALALTTLGQSDRINSFALRHLRSTAVVNDVFKGLRGFVNPFQSLPS